jgi:hypothetical protein
MYTRPTAERLVRGDGSLDLKERRRAAGEAALTIPKC